MVEIIRLRAPQARRVELAVAAVREAGGAVAVADLVREAIDEHLPLVLARFGVDAAALPVDVPARPTPAAVRARRAAAERERRKAAREVRRLAALAESERAAQAVALLREGGASWQACADALNAQGLLNPGGRGRRAWTARSVARAMTATTATR